jgi:hypothetical protein
MCPASTKALAAALPENIRYLATQIARKPPEYTHEWASTVDEAFSKYTNTRTVNLILSWSNVLAEAGWPFPGFLSLREETAVSRLPRITKWNILCALLRGGPILYAPLIAAAVGANGHARAKSVDGVMTLAFNRHNRRTFNYWLSRRLLRHKATLVRQIRTSYRRGLFATCMPAVLALLDFVIRDYFQSDRLNVSVQTLRDGLTKAGLSSDHLKPGFGVWDLAEQTNERPILPSKDSDLRLPGVLLASFVQFASSYYAWYRVAGARSTGMINRHAIMHCATDYWTAPNATKLLTFFDLALRLERPLRILIHGSNAHSGRVA